MCDFPKAGQAFPQQTEGGRLSRYHSPQHLWLEKAVSTAQVTMFIHLCSLIASLPLRTNGKCKGLQVPISRDSAAILHLQ